MTCKSAGAGGGGGGLLLCALTTFSNFYGGITELPPTGLLVVLAQGLAVLVSLA